jgi:hypothetical protein
MEEAAAVLARLERIETLQRDGALSHRDLTAALLEELRELLREAEEWARTEGGDAGARAVGDLRSALSSDMVGV